LILFTLAVLPEKGGTVAKAASMDNFKNAMLVGWGQ